MNFNSALQTAIIKFDVKETFQHFGKYTFVSCPELEDKINAPLTVCPFSNTTLKPGA